MRAPLVAAVATLAIGFGTSLGPQAPASADRPVWPGEGPRTWTPRPTESGITANDLRTRLYQLADDSMKGRRIGEEGNTTATDYIAREFARLGLKPAGDHGTWFQVLPWGPGGFDSTASVLTIGTEPLAPTRDWIPVSPAVQGTIGSRVDLAQVPTVFAGRWGDTGVRLDPAIFRGKVAVFVGGPTGRGGGGAGRAGGGRQRCDSVPDKFGAAAAAEVEAAERAARAGRGGGRGGGSGSSADSAQDSRAAAAGAVAMLFTGLESLPRNTLRTAFRVQPTLDPAGVGLPAARIADDVAARLFARPVESLSIGTTGVPVSGHWDFAWRAGRWPARNVIAMLPGSDPALAGEYVLVGAHNDHVGVDTVAVDHDSLRAVNTVTRRQGSNDPACRPTAGQQRRIDSLIAYARSIRPPRRDSISNGADDDGSGTVVLLELAERFSREKPARSIIFISHEGEESGLRGSRWFTEHPTIPLTQIAAAVNMDMVGKGRVSEVKFGGPASVQMLGARRLSREFGDIIDSVNAVRSEVMAIDRSWDVTANPMNRFCRSDQVNYVRKDVPIVYVSLGYAQDYHQVTDEPAYIDYEHAARVGRFVFDILSAVAARKDRPAVAGRDPAYPSC